MKLDSRGKSAITHHRGLAEAKYAFRLLRGCMVIMTMSNSKTE